MSSSPFRWRFPNRKSSTPFFPGAWPNGSVQDTQLSKNVAPNARVGSPGDVSVATTPVKPRQPGSSQAAHSADEPLQHLDQVTAFHRKLSHSLESAHTAPCGSHSLESELPDLTDTSQMASCVDMCSSPSSSTIPTPSPLSPATSVSFPYRKSVEPTQANKKPFALSRIVPHEKNKAKSSKSRSFEPNPPGSDSSPELQSASLVPGLPPLSLPSHTLSFSPESVASFFTSSEQSCRPASHADTPPPTLPSPPSGTPASFVVPSPVSQEASPSGIPSSPAFARSFYPIYSESDNGGQGIHGLLSPLTVGSHEYRDDSPVLPSDEETQSNFLRPLSPPRREALTPSSAEMDAFGLAASGIPPAQQSDDSIPTSLQSGFVAEAYGDPDDTVIATAYSRPRRSTSSSTLSLSSIGTVSVRQFADSVEDDLSLSRQRRRPVHPRSRATDRSVVTSIVQGAANKTNSKPTKVPGLAQVKKFSGKLKRLLGFKSKSSMASGTQIGVTTTTAVTAVEYTSEHPIPLAEPKRRKTEANLGASSRTPKQLTKQQRRRSMPITGTAKVSHPRALRPMSFLAMNSKESTARTLPSPSRIAELQQALGGKDASRSSVKISGSQTEGLIKADAKQNHHKRISTTRSGKSPAPEDRTLDTPSSAKGKRARTLTAPNTPTSPSPAKARRFSLSSGLTSSKVELLRTALTPHPPLPPFSRDQFGRVQSFGNSPEAGPSMSQPKSKVGGGSARKAKAQSMIVGQLHARKPVPDLNTVSVDTREFSKPIITLPREVRSTEMQDREMRQTSRAREEIRPSSTELTPLSPMPPAMTPDIINRAEEQPKADAVKRRRSRGLSLTSNVSKRAQKARSMIMGRGSANADMSPSTKPEPQGEPKADVRHALLTRGSSFGCADYEPDLVMENMCFAPKAGLSSSAVSECEVALDQPMDTGTMYTIPPDALNVCRMPDFTPPEDYSDAASGREMDPEGQQERGFVEALDLVE